MIGEGGLGGGGWTVRICFGSEVQDQDDKWTIDRRVADVSEFMMNATDNATDDTVGRTTPGVSGERSQWQLSGPGVGRTDSHTLFSCLKRLGR